MDQLRGGARQLSLAVMMGALAACSTGGGASKGGGAGAGGTAGAVSAGGAVGSGGSGVAGATTAAGGRGAGGASAPGGAAGVTSTFPLKQAPGQRYLVDQNGKPFLLVGDSAWSLLVAVSRADADAYLDDRQAKGINSILVNLIEHQYTPDPPRNLAGDLPFTATLSAGVYDFTTPNEAYFAHADTILKDAAARGMVVQLAAAYLGAAGGDEGWYAEMEANGVSRLSTYGRYVGNRYKSFPNVIWVGGGDYNPPDPALTDAVESGILASDPNHLHTGHANGGTAAEDEFGSYPWLTVNTIYGYPSDGDFVYAMAQAQYSRADWLPFFLIESSYELTIDSPAGIRQQMYEAILNGGFGENFGNEWIWTFSVSYGGSNGDWKPQLSSQGSWDQSRVASLFQPRAWYGLVPDRGGTFLTSGAGTGDGHVSAALSGDGRLGIVYTPAASFTLSLGKMAGTVNVRWYDPSTGAWTAVAGSPFANSGTRTFTPPATNGTSTTDWVLVLEATN